MIFIVRAKTLKEVNHYDTYAAKVEFIIKCKEYFP